MFAVAKEFHFEGNPRSLQLWDESFLPSEPTCISIKSLNGLDDAYREIDPEFCDAMEPFLRLIAATEAGSVVNVPDVIPPLKAKAGDGWDGYRIGKLIEHKGNTGKLAMMLGRSMLLTSDKVKGRMLVGATAPLPPDFMPIVFDASARVRADYRLWQAHDHRVRIASPVVNDYRNLTINLWKKGSGRSTLGKDDQRAYILDHVAKVINMDAAAEWLVIHYKPGWFDIAKDLRRLVDNPERLSFRHWGDVHGTNEYRRIRNVMVIGSYNLPDTAHVARYLAATGKEPHELDGNEGFGIRPGEIQHNLLQAISRSNVRNSFKGVAGEATVYLIASPNPDPGPLLEEAFPGCTITPWNPEPPKLSGWGQKLADTLIAMFSDRSINALAKKDVRAACGIAKAKGLSDVLRQAPVQAFLIEQGIGVISKAFVRAAG
jgi:hypothetical protein